MSSTEAILTAVVLGAATAVATDYVEVPYASLHSTLITVILVIVALLAFGKYPAVGLSLFFLIAVLYFKRNVNRTILSSSRAYGDRTIMTQPHVTARPFESESSGPRPYGQFQETNPANPMLGPIKSAIQEPFEPAPYGDEQGAPVEGQFPKEQDRTSSSPETQDYTYRPDAATGSTEFERYGPDLDEKMDAFKY